MIELTARPARTSFSGPEKELKQMFKALRVKDEKGAWWRARAALSRKVEGWWGISIWEQKKLIQNSIKKFKYIKFYDRRSDTFETGLVKKVCKFLRKKGIAYLLSEMKRPKLEPIKRMPFSVEQRGEQLEAVNAALKRGRGILFCATNFGKTETAGAIIFEYYKQTGRVPRVLFLIHRKSLVQQTADRFRKYFPRDVRVLMVGGGKKNLTKGRGVIVSTVQTASNILRSPDFERFQERCDILFIDEFHLNKAWACYSIVKENAAVMRFGLSGTIDQKNKVKMMRYIGMTGPVIAETRNKELVELGRSAKPFIRFVETNSREIPKRAKFAAAYNLGVVKDRDRNKLVVREAVKYLKRDYKTLVTVSRISHGLELKRLFENKLDLRVEFLSGSSPMHVRERVIRDFRKGKVGVLIASPIFDTGVDIPAIQAWVNAAGGKGWELVLQRLGRVLRKKKGDNRVFISDFVDLHNAYLMRHSIARLNHYKRERIAEISIVETKT